MESRRRGKLIPYQTKRRNMIMENNANKCIACTVQQCAYHCQNEDYCSLASIQVGTHEMNPTDNQCTDCKSFRRK
jgi:hypothetical protein